MQQKPSGCLVPMMIAVGTFVVLVIIGAMFLPEERMSTNTASNNDTSIPCCSSRHAGFNIGERAIVGNWDLVVEKVEKTTLGIGWSALGNKVTPEGTFILVYVNATNTSDKTDSINSFDYMLRDSIGAEFAACNLPACNTYPKQVSRQSFSTETPPGTITNLLAIFDVPIDTKDLALEIEHDIMISLGSP
jgi:Domain of unknown function (DUF4352)